ncbi:MAG: hypothetical protein KDB22_28200 [Planctomycetales bacterium]|nr:hypothetical protein [Planctomycetales bacterium]
MHFRRLKCLTSLSLACLLGTATARAVRADDLNDWLQVLQSMDQSQDPALARDAWKKVVDSGVDSLPAVLAAFDPVGPKAANWLRSAVDAIAEDCLADQRKLPQQRLEQFITDTQRSPLARRLAYEWLFEVDPTVKARMVPGMLHDPSLELRRDAVAMQIEAAEAFAEAQKNPEAIDGFLKALGGARDEDQVKLIAKRLREMGQQVDLPNHFGFLQQWYLIGPFDNTALKGFATEFPPEKEIDLDKRYEGKLGPVNWTKFEGNDDFGMIDLNKPLGQLKEVTGYAWTVFNSPVEQDVELRLGCKNGWKMWLNGELLFARDEYHRGMKIDQYKMKAHLKPGENQILMKLCQDKMTESWTVEWQFQLRVCDAAGTAILPAPSP